MNSPYASFLHTNYTPTDSEILHIKQLLTEPLARLSALDAEIARMQAILDNMHSERRALNEEIDAHRALISPIRQLPLDVIGEIFVHCLPQHRNAVMSAQEAPILLGRICGAWRSIALSTPRLWASLHIPTPTLQADPPFVLKMQRRCEVSEEWIARSGDCPLSISVKTPDHLAYDGPPSSNMDTFEIAIMHILTSSQRWKSVDFSAVEGSFGYLQQLAEEDVPMLESLTIVSGWVTSEGVSPGESWVESSSLLSAPKLRKLSLSCLKEDLLSLPVRWSQLTHLKLDVDGPPPSGLILDGLKYSHVIKVLKNCPLLVSCGLSIRGQRFHSDIVGQPDSGMDSRNYTLTLPFLEYFFVHLREEEDNIKYLSLPVLRHLKIEYRGSPPAAIEDRTFLTDFLSRNGAALKQLFIHIASMTRDELMHILQLVPFLTHLHVGHPRYSDSDVSIIDDEVIDRLSPSGENLDCLCPMLEEFDCEGGFSEARLMSFIKKRADSEKGGLLKMVNVTIDRYKPKNLEEFFVSLATEAGMKAAPAQLEKDVWADVCMCIESKGTSTIVAVSYDSDLLMIDFRYSPWDGLDLGNINRSSLAKFSLNW